MIKGGTCLTPAGRVATDVGVARRARRGLGRSRARGGGRDDRRQGPARAARRHRHPGAFPRARPRAQGRSGERHARGGARRRHRGLRDAQHQSEHDDGRGARRQGQARARAASGATSPSSSAPRPTTPRQLATLERLPGCCGVKIFMGSSTGSLLVAEDEAVARVLSHGFRRCAVHSEDEARLRERRKLVEGGASGARTSRMARRRDGVARDAASRGARRARASSRPRAARHDRRRDSAARRSTRISSRSR